MKVQQSIFLVCFISLMCSTHLTTADNGSTSIAKWKDNKQGAYTLRFDDSMMSHKDHTIPNLIKRGLTASFFINPATNRYGYGIETWESLVSRTGIEICPHTMNHIGAADLEEADYEIGEAFKKVWELYPPDKSKLYPFNRGGGTSWPGGYLEAVQSKYPVANYFPVSVRYSGGDDRKELIDFAEKAMKDDEWHTVLTHGTGPNLEWLGFEASNFEALLDYLATVKDKMWVGTAGDIFKYIMERESARVEVLQSNGQMIQLNLISEVDAGLFDYPLTLITEVPDTWAYCHVTQDKLRGIYPVKSGKVMYEVLPNRGVIKLTGSNMDQTPPSQVLIRDGTAEDIDTSPFTTQVSANWEAAEDGESGISRYWYKIGTTPGGSEVLDWIDNGLVRSFTTSRTNLYLTRGEKYYVTVKVVNGVGLSSESTSDGFTISMIPGYISFSEDFDNGYLTQWNEKHTKEGSDKNLLYITEEAAHNGLYGLQCHLEEGQSGRPFLAKYNISESAEVFTSFYFKLSPDFRLSPDNADIRLLELKDASGEFVAQVSVGFKEDIGYHVFASGQDNTGYNASLPGFSGTYYLNYIPIKTDEWIRIDLRTIANDSKGGTELFVNGVREGCITNRLTGGEDVRNLYIGALVMDKNTISGDIFFDDIKVADSYLK